MIARNYNLKNEKHTLKSLVKKVYSYVKHDKNFKVRAVFGTEILNWHLKIFSVPYVMLAAPEATLSDIKLSWNCSVANIPL